MYGTMTSTARSYRGVSAADRQSERRARLIEAGFDVLGEHGLVGTTMKAVRIRAGLSERYFYESFRDSTELVAALVDTLSAELTAAWSAAVVQAPAELEPRVRAMISTAIAVFSDDPRKARTYVEAVLGRAIRAHRAPYYYAHAAALAAQLDEVGAWGDHADKEAVRTTVLTLFFGIANTIGLWINGRIGLTRDQLADQLSGLVMAVTAASREPAPASNRRQRSRTSRR
jgi:AcrR family transcriptional regulator